jgi:2-iminobutanoate/2-iminopropanoate deaminase
MSPKNIIFTPNAPIPIGPYNQAVVTDRFVFISGQIGIDLKTGKLVEGGVTEETRQIFSNLQAILSSIGLSFSNIVKTTIYLTDLTKFDEVNKLYSEYFIADFPARATVEVKSLPRGASIELEAIAFIE